MIGFRNILLTSMERTITIIDIKTRWNSLENMLARFLKISSSIQKTLVDLKMSHLYPLPNEIKIVEQITKVWFIAKESLLLLGRRDCTVYDADQIHCFMFKN